ncbi:hypothetical protein [Pseudorhodobacter sp.]|uniref:hypothetical protein n=1 Tax=Pseudorhodobacter sp. TaxID=1934400 RepID=UPI002649984A|nr:hypothetical protein [Pseudorhodobacter sp.]MDN5788347.1 hypothetical protein [Pseudorhodobacter sp.]
MVVPDFSDPLVAAVQLGPMVDNMINERPVSVAELLAQADYAGAYWANLLAMNPATKPNSFILLSVAYTIGQMVGMYFKDFFGVARPVHLIPTLVTSIPTPAHPSFPSNHSLQNHLVLQLLTAAMPDGEAGHLFPYMQLLTDRLARNREVAGVHFRADTDAGRDIAAWLWTRHLSLMPAVTDVINAAKSEWSDRVGVQELNIGT